jgi:hypothetical protein
MMMRQSKTSRASITIGLTYFKIVVKQSGFFAVMENGVGQSHVLAIVVSYCHQDER